MSLEKSAHLIPERPAEIEERYFRFAQVSDASDLEKAYRIRYQVYCVERGFMSVDDYPTGLECDEYDAVSVQILATHLNGFPAGTARLVLHSPLGFPLMRHCLFSGEYEHLNDPSNPAHATFAEISRMSVAKMFRRREGDTLYGGPPRISSTSVTDGKIVPLVAPRNTPEILIGISRLLYRECKRRGITHLMLAMERTLYVMCRRIGFVYFPAGPEIDYFGPVRPYVTSIEQFEANLFKASPETFRYMVRGLAPDLVPSWAKDSDADMQVCSTASLCATTG